MKFINKKIKATAMNITHRFPMRPIEARIHAVCLGIELFLYKSRHFRAHSYNYFVLLQQPAKILYIHNR